MEEQAAGEGKTVSWPTGISGDGAVANYVKQIPNSIGYVLSPYVVQSGMAYARLGSGGRISSSPTPSLSPTLPQSADWAKASDFNLVMTNAPGANAYPITATTFILMPKQPEGQSQVEDAGGAELLQNMRWKRPAAGRLDYVPLPDALVKRIETYIGASIHEVSPPAAPRSGAGADRLFQLATAGTTWLVLLFSGGRTLSMAWAGAFETFGWGFIAGSRMGHSPGHFGALPIYGTLRGPRSSRS